MVKTIIQAISRRAAALEDNIFQAFTSNSRRAYGIGFILLMVLVAATSTLIFLTGAVPQRDSPWDSVFILDGAWRLAQGMRPHSDYADLLGVTSFLPPLLGMAMVGCKSEALAYGPAVLLPVMAFWGWNVARRRFSALYSFLVAAFLGGLVIGAFPLGYMGWLTLGYQMQYNRFLWSLACLLALLVFLEPRGEMTRFALASEGIGAGVLGGLLLAGKVTYAGAAVLLLVAGLVLGRSGKGRGLFWRTATFALLAMMALYLLYSRGDVGSYWNDLRPLMSVQRSSSKSHALSFVIAMSWWEFLMPCLVAFLSLRRILPCDKPAEAVRGLKRLAAVAFLVGLGILITETNTQNYAIPLCAVAVVILAEYLARSGGKGDSPRLAGSPYSDDSSEPRTVPFSAVASAATRHDEAFRLRVVLGYGAAGIALLVFCVPDYTSVAYAFLWKKTRAASMPDDAKFACPGLGDMLCPPPTYDPVEIDAIRQARSSGNKIRWTPFEFANYVNEGLKLLEGRVDKDSRITNCDWCNPFPVALQLQTARGSPMGWASFFTDDDSVHPPLDLVFRDVTHVMVPKRPIDTFGERACGAYVREHFVKEAESPYWTLYVRKRAARQ